MKLLTHNFERSNSFKDNARKIIPHQTGTFSRAASSYVEEIKNFLDAITKKSLVKHTFENEFKLLKVLDAIEISNKKSKKIIIHK